MAEIPKKILVNTELVAELRAIVGAPYALVEKENVIVYEQDGSTFYTIPEIVGRAMLSKSAPW